MPEHQSARAAFVLHVFDEGYKVAINKGSADGLKIGDRYLVYGMGPQFSDPVTGEDLGELEVVRGRGIVTHVQERMSTLKSTETRIRKSRKRTVETGVNIFGREVIEETPEPEQVPFDSARSGDLAKPV